MLMAVLQHKTDNTNHGSGH